MRLVAIYYYYMHNGFTIDLLLIIWAVLALAVGLGLKVDCKCVSEGGGDDVWGANVASKARAHCSSSKPLANWLTACLNC